MKPKSKSTITRLDIIELANHLRLENLFISSEKRQIQTLNEKVLESSERIFHMSWIIRKQRLNLERLEKDANPVNCCFAASALENANFVDSYKKLGSLDSSLSDLLTKLRKNPKLLAHCLIEGEAIFLESISNVIPTIICSLYCDCLLHEDRILVLQLLRELLIHQLSNSSNPRRLLRNTSCAFSKVYKLFSECLTSAKLFLAASLREAVINVLIEDDLYLDMDPQRAVQRFSREERARHFGQEKTLSYQENLQQFRLYTVEKLSALVSKFIEGIQSNIYCFPESLCWLVKQLHAALTSTKKLSEKEVGIICADVIFEYFICHAIVNPELYGIVDIQISNIARFNLVQVAQIIQALALQRWEDTDPKFNDFFAKFTKDCISSVLDFLIMDSNNELPSNAVPYASDVVRTCALIAEADLYDLMKFFYEVHKACKNNETKKMLGDMLGNISETALDKLRERNTSAVQGSDSNVSTDTRQKRNLLTKVARRAKGENSNEVLAHRDASPNTLNASNKIEVLVLPITNYRDFEAVGMLTEEKVLALEMQKRHTKVRMNLETDRMNANDETESTVSSSFVGDQTEKKPRFFHDQESIGTSDNLEAVSEAASNHSVASSVDLENENENDNFSDMVSANVSSGRGTPNVSGRETPSSQSSPSENGSVDGNDTTAVVVNNQLQGGQPAQNADTLNSIPVEQPNRANNTGDIEEKFGKFDCKPCASADETKSLVSDTWSTDVLASDSEALEQSEAALAAAAQASLSFLATQSFQGQFQNQMDASETASQSDAWSTDVLTSDTERLQEFDLEETGSISRSEDSILARSEMEGEESGAAGGATLPAAAENVLENFMYFGEDYQKDGTIKHSNRKNKLSNTPRESNPTFKLSLNDIPRDDVTHPLGVHENSSPKHLSSARPSSPVCEPSLNGSMQTLGRLSFDVRRMPLNEEDSVSLLLPLLRENAPEDSPNLESLVKHRSSLSELLSLDFSKHGVIDNKQLSSAVSSSDSLNLMDFEKEICSVDKIAKSNLENATSARTSTNNTNDFLTSETTDVASLSKPANVEVVRPSLSTGAIPKTRPISNASSNSAESPRNSSREEDTPRSARKSFFKLPNLKVTIKEKMKSFKDKKGPFTLSNDVVVSEDEGQLAKGNETSDAILEKYRERKEVSMSRPTGSHGISQIEHINCNAYDEDESYAFENTKRILRYVLSAVDVKILPTAATIVSGCEKSHLRCPSELVKFLKLLLAEAKYMQNSSHIVAIQEAMRAVEAFDEKSSQKLFWSLREDYQRRSPYIAYLIRSKQALLATLAQFQSIEEHLLRDQGICKYNLVVNFTRIFTDGQERKFLAFVRKFQTLTALDEKAQLVEKFLQYLYNVMDNDSLWQVSSSEQLENAKRIIERTVMSQIYMYALYPNGDGDWLRDQLLHQHVQNFAKNLTPDHKALRIPKMYHSECPWPVAQEQILAINAYKSPREKVHCVIGCCTIIMNLLSLASEKSVPAADDLIPVLVFVLIKANPSSLLSNVQYVNCFYEKQLEGEESYWWTQFCSAVEFIKTIV